MVCVKNTCNSCNAAGLFEQQATGGHDYIRSNFSSKHMLLYIGVDIFPEDFDSARRLDQVIHNIRISFEVNKKLS